MLLEGIRVVDLTSVVMGPLATRMLADMGADVIWVESPDGDVLRDYEPMQHAKMSAFSMSMSRNKRSVVLDLKTEPGREAMRDRLAPGVWEASGPGRAIVPSRWAPGSRSGFGSRRRTSRTW